ncbi:ras family small GTPase [Naegleria gruberi]|uniref:Ras family small GTPase n=1 Tax=Naegleria gruberi TaxID=5762 RepID=D2VNK2_NAEGR|nr:ras family small GTPase [Naegleria gruberi]EFC41674.1 ras family small GTPase [Naegleria gruberi]|eukprot:XP_002674418.1 ras family small GTPase [Naegleria gruberi strain NEG-M]
MKFLELPPEIACIIRCFLIRENNSSSISECKFKFSHISTNQHEEIISFYMKLETEWFKLKNDHIWVDLLEYEAKNCNLSDLQLSKWKKQFKKNINFRRKVLLVRWARAQYITNILEKDLPMNGVKESLVSLLGISGVGKTSICNYFAMGHFYEDYSCGIEDTTRKMINPSFGGDEQVVTSTRKLFNSLLRARDREWNDFPVLFAINKVDIPDQKRRSSIENIQSFIGTIIEEFDLRNTAIFETSAREGININEIFEHVVLKMEYYEQFPFLPALEDVLVNDIEALKNLELWNITRRKQRKCLVC